MEWQERARCKDLSIEEADKLFFLGRGGSPKKAIAFCAECPVQRECRTESILYDEQGIWAGLTDEQRELMSPTLKPLLQEEALREGPLKVFYRPNVHSESSSNPIRCQYCGDKQSDTHHCTSQQTSNWWQTDESIDDSEFHETSPETQDKESSNQPDAALRLAS